MSGDIHEYGLCEICSEHSPLYQGLCDKCNHRVEEDFKRVFGNRATNLLPETKGQLLPETYWPLSGGRD